MRSNRDDLVRMRRTSCAAPGVVGMSSSMARTRKTKPKGIGVSTPTIPKTRNTDPSALNAKRATSIPPQLLKALRQPFALLRRLEQVSYPCKLSSSCDSCALPQLGTALLNSRYRRSRRPFSWAVTISKGISLKNTAYQVHCSVHSGSVTDADALARHGIRAKWEPHITPNRDRCSSNRVTLSRKMHVHSTEAFGVASQYVALVAGRNKRPRHANLAVVRRRNSDLFTH